MLQGTQVTAGLRAEMKIRTDGRGKASKEGESVLRWAGKCQLRKEDRQAFVISKVLSQQSSDSLPSGEPEGCLESP